MAGNCESESVRYDLLYSLRNRDDLSREIVSDLDVLLPVINLWANGRNLKSPADPNDELGTGYLNRFIWLKVSPGDDWPGKISPTSPVYPLWAYYRARALLWRPIESGGIRHDARARKAWYGEARTLLDVAGRAYPENLIIGMYRGTATKWPLSFRQHPDAPAWANLQREGLEKLTELIHWWIDHRQLADGRFGGGWGDDVEMWRWWTPILVGFEDPKVIEAQRRLSRGVLNSPQMSLGYTSVLTDVEHSAETTADTITPMLFLDPEALEWQSRAIRIVRLAKNRWTGENDRGLLQFKSTYFSVSEVRLDPDVACDTVYHPRVLLPALILWLRSGDEEIGRFVTRWMDTWVDAARRSENGKPAGVLPSAIHWPDGEVGGGVDAWWNPQNYGADLFAWPSAMPMMTKSLLLAYHMTGDTSYLSPIKSMTAIWSTHLDHPPNEPPSPGSEAWCALVGTERFGGQGMKSFLPETLSKYRVLTGDGQYDSILQHHANGYLRMRLGQGLDTLTEELQQNAKAFRINREGYTSEMRWTDRVLRFNELWGNDGNDWDWPEPNVAALYSSVTGDPGGPDYFPLNAVRWLTPARDFAALVTESGTSRFTAELYHFGKAARSLSAEFLLLQPGHYRWTLSDDEQELDAGELHVAGSRTKLQFRLPKHRLSRLRVELQK